MKKCWNKQTGEMRYWTYNGAWYFTQYYTDKDANQSVWSEEEFKRKFTLKPYIQIKLF